MSDMQIVQHSRMIQDRPRMDFFERSLAALRPRLRSVVDIGSGSGVLSALALELGAERVRSIEYFDDIAALSRKALNRWADRVQVIQGRSFDVTLEEFRPEILVSETIGLLGPEENIVEIIHDFVRRHPSIEHIIPAELSIHACWVHSDRIAESKARDLEGFDRHSCFAGVKRDVEMAYCSQVRTDKLGDSGLEILDFETEIVRYDLGKSRQSSFRKVIDLNGRPPTCNALHLFFKAHTSAGEFQLSSAVSSPLTHWGHSYVPLPEQSDPKSLVLSYQAGSGALRVKWET